MSSSRQPVGDKKGVRAKDGVATPPLLVDIGSSVGGLEATVFYLSSSGGRSQDGGADTDEQ